MPPLKKRRVENKAVYTDLIIRTLILYRSDVSLGSPVHCSG